MKVKRSKYVFFYHQFQPKFDLEIFFYEKAEKCFENQILAISILFGQEVIISSLEYELVMSYNDCDFVEISNNKFEEHEILFKYGILFLNDHPKEFLFSEFIEKQNKLIDNRWHIYSALYNFMTKWEGMNVSLTKESALLSNSTLSQLTELYGTPPTAFHKISNFNESKKFKLDDISEYKESFFYSVLRKRLTTRVFDTNKKMSYENFSKIVYSAFGVIGTLSITENEEDNLNLIALKKASPSGGSLHPSEGYFLVLRVEGLDPGYYHYDSENNQLVLMRSLELFEAIEMAYKLTVGQEYTCDSSFLCFIATRYFRNYWKYSKHSGAYLVTIRDAAHICQTAYLTSSYLNLGCFTAAINQADVEKELNLDPFEEGICMMFGCGIPDVNEKKDNALQPKLILRS